MMTSHRNDDISYIRYMANEEAKELAERQDGMEEVVKKKPRKKYFTKEVDFSELNDRKMVRCAKILERMVNQNNYNEIAIGCKKSLMRNELDLK